MVTKEEVLVAFKISQSDVSKFKNQSAKFQNSINTTNRKMADKSIRMQRATTDATKFKYKQELLGLKRVKLNQQLGMDKNSALMTTAMKNSSLLAEKRDKLIDIGTREARQQKWSNKLLTGGADKLLKNADVINGLEKEHNSLGKAYGMTNDKLRTFTEGGGEFTKKSARMGNKLRMMTAGLKGFKMEFLGIMFFGMALSRMFTGLLKPTTQAFGIMELWGDMLTVVFLPIISALMPYFVELMTYFMKLDPSTQKLIGLFTILGAVFGTVLFVVGTLALGLGSIGVAGGGAFLLMMGSIVLVLIGIPLIIFGIVKAIKNWKTDTKKSMGGIQIALLGLALIVIAFAGWWLLIPIAVAFVIATIIKNWDSFKLFFERLWINIKITFNKAITGIMQGLATYYEQMSKVPLIGGLYKKGADIMNKAIDSQQVKLDELNAKLAENKILQDEIKYGTNDTQTITEQSSGVQSMNDQFLATQTTGAPGTVTNNITLTVQDEDSIRRTLSDLKDELLGKLDRAGGGGR